MKYNNLGNTKIKLGAISLGTMTFREQCSPSESVNIMDYAFEKGINFFDTAEMSSLSKKEAATT